MRRTAFRIAVAVAAAVAVSAIAWPIYGESAFLGSVKILAPLGAATTLLADLIASHRSWIRGLRGQLGALAVLAAAQLGVTVALFASLMFVSEHDAFFMALAIGYAGLVGLAAARLVAIGALSDLDAMRRAVAKVGEGSRDVRVPVRGGDELATLAADLEGMVAKLDAAERTRRQLVAAVSHDLRTPITSLQLTAEGLEDNIFEPEARREQQRLIGTHVRALSALIDDLFELSRLEAGDIKWSIEHVHLEELLCETIEAMRPHADAGGIAVRAELDAAITPARGNPEQLQRVLFNLIQNAIRHTPADGSVVVRAEPAPGPAVEIEIADSGSGIDPALRDEIFEPWVQGPSRVSGKNGSAGLGLAIARAIVEAHGGRIWVADTSPGTRVRFSLPAA
ncbi:MAG TPA: HAMP domain-containing sensor histidine kinase [Solirubrobacteraceae bacterium]|nr:HAMP domain-containing sensor histidine kinase [Solirubrobacteraceae bacterium]